MMKVPVWQNAEKIRPGDALKTASPGKVIAGTKLNYVLQIKERRGVLQEWERC